MKDWQHPPAYSVRLPVALRTELKQLADSNRRSLASEIVFRLEEAVKSIQRQQQGAA